jgi:hypothetical protein
MPSQPASRPDNYYTQHAPLGAFASFSIGMIGRPGGFGHALRGPANQNVYVGYQVGEAAWAMLPFFRPPQSNEAAFTGEAATAQAPTNVKILGPDDYTRSLGWASDTWTTPAKFAFSILSPFGEVGDPQKLSRSAARQAFSPHVNAWIEFDNTAGTAPARLIFGIGEPDGILRPLEDTAPGLAGFAHGTQWGYATLPGPAVEQRQGFDILNLKFKDYRGLHVIAGETALVFTVPAGKKKRFPLALGFFESGVITTGIRASYAYTRWFDDLEDVLAHGLKNRAAYEKVAAQRDRELARTKLSDDQKFLVAQSAHSYLGSSQLIWGAKGPTWVVNEGEYRMMNTFDLTVDHVFFELRYFPWAVRNALDLFVTRYAYTDKIKLADGRTVPGGIAFTHDMGVNNQFTPPGHSSYECDHLHGCFSHMTMEQLLNWVLTAVCYAEKTGDTAWLRKRKATLLACAESMRRRDHPDAKQRDGLLKHDSARCGPEGAEITTYDSLDVSLGQARNNLYLSVKALGAWVLLERAFTTLRLARDAAAARASGDLLAATVATKFEPETASFPAVFEKGNRSRIIPAVEGFVYPLYLGLKDATDRKGRFAKLLGLLELHLAGIMKPGVCIDAVSGGWKMSSTSTNTWFSKIALSQHVVRQLFPAALGEEARAADRVHADWQRQPGCGEFAMCDQIHSDTGVTCGSRYYPRGVTTILWLDE